MPIIKKVEEKKKASPPPEVIPAGYEKYVTYDSKESDQLARIANDEGHLPEPSVKHLGHTRTEEGRFQHSYLKKIVKKAGMYALVISLLWGGNAFATRSGSGLDNTRDFHERKLAKVGEYDLTEIFARTRGGAEIKNVSVVSAETTLTLATGDYYTITGDTSVIITGIAAASTYTGRQITIAKLNDGSSGGFSFTDGNNLLLPNNVGLSAGDTLTLACFDDKYWYQVASSDN